jgi:hypothetical protein
MADITMCEGVNCDKRLTCYRYLATANPYAQSYFSETPINNGECDMYWHDVKFNGRKS